jgi:hypothetical protein
MYIEPMDVATETPATLPTQVRELTEGSVVEVVFGRKWDTGAPQTRTVRVTELMETDICFYAFTTSGRTPLRGGGVLTIWKRDNSVTFQPTMRQNMDRVVSINVQGLAN